ncbi:uncharacterized protein LOC135825594 [Sycon ciliatum]|uniref:uncharacterized protein LOC135825594 n=1 Tax=Sycon ciliatum TaxID=27933 RepID=UPI0031F68134
MGDPMGWYSGSGDLLWNITNGSPSTNGTGTAHDATFKNSSGYYMYLNVSGSGGAIRNQASLLSPTYLPSSRKGGKMQFSYRMSVFGSGTGNLSLDMNVSGHITRLWSKTGDQGSAWRTAKVTIPASSPYQLRFRGTYDGALGNIALDDIKADLATYCVYCGQSVEDPNGTSCQLTCESVPSCSCPDPSPSSHSNCSSLFLPRSPVSATQSSRPQSCAPNVSCKCSTGFQRLDHCCVDMDECVNAQHQCNAATSVCMNTVGSYRCDCIKGYYSTKSDQTCLDIDECTRDAPCSAVGNSTCKNFQGSFACICLLGFGAILNGTGRTEACRNVNMTLPPPCGTNQVHVYTGTGAVGFVCECKPGFRRHHSGDCHDINECSDGSHACSRNAICQNVDASYTCSCILAYAGNGFYCSDVDECGSSPCGAASECRNVPGSYGCYCRYGYSPHDASNTSCYNVDECSNRTHNCDEYATCTDHPGNYACHCDAGYHGNGTVCYKLPESVSGGLKAWVIGVSMIVTFVATAIGLLAIVVWRGHLVIPSKATREKVSTVVTANASADVAFAHFPSDANAREEGSGENVLDIEYMDVDREGGGGDMIDEDSQYIVMAPSLALSSELLNHCDSRSQQDPSGRSFAGKAENAVACPEEITHPDQVQTYLDEVKQRRATVNRSCSLGPRYENHNLPKPEKQRSRKTSLEEGETPRLVSLPPVAPEERFKPTKVKPIIPLSTCARDFLVSSPKASNRLDRATSERLPSNTHTQENAQLGSSDALEEANASGNLTLIDLTANNAQLGSSEALDKANESRALTSNAAYSITELDRTRSAATNGGKDEADSDNDLPQTKPKLRMMIVENSRDPADVKEVVALRLQAKA